MEAGKFFNGLHAYLLSSDYTEQTAEKFPLSHRRNLLWRIVRCTPDRWWLLLQVAVHLAVQFTKLLKPADS